MVPNGEEGLVCEVHVDGILLEHVLEFQYLGIVLDESGTDGAECNRKMVSGRRVAVATGSLVNARDLQLECAGVLHETLLVPVLMHGSETMLWRGKKRSRVRAVQMDNLRGLLGVGRMDRVPNAWIGEFSRVRVWMKGLMRAFYGGLAMWRGWRDRITKRVYVGE